MRPEVPLYTCDSGQLVADAWEVLRGGRADEIFPVSRPSKMDCPAWGISVELCRTGTKLREVLGSTCHSCYAMIETPKAEVREGEVIRKCDQGHRHVT